MQSTDATANKTRPPRAPSTAAAEPEFQTGNGSGVIRCGVKGRDGIVLNTAYVTDYSPQADSSEPDKEEESEALSSGARRVGCLP